MKDSIVIGKTAKKKVTLELNILLRTRLLIQANSGGGKSFLIRRLAEQLFGRIPVLLVDPEGEFATLREKYGYVLVGKGGETPADPRSAALVAHRLLELRASAVCDLYEMKPSERHRWVRLFLDALIDAPKKLWRPTIVVVDEAHQFCMDAETEILTPRGWSTWRDVQAGTEVVAYDPATGRYANEAVTHIILRQHEGPMVTLKSDGINALVTPDHRVVLRRTQRAAEREYKIYPPTFCTAGEVPSHVYIPAGGAPEGQGIVGLSEDFARLLGWIITDGSFVGGHGGEYRRYLSISQSRATCKRGRSMVDELLALTERLSPERTVYERPLRHRESLGRSFNSAPSVEIYLGRDLSARTLCWFGVEIHRVPRTILQHGSRAQLAALYLGLLEGDGTSWHGEWSKFYAGKNEPLADDFQELATRLGISTSKAFVATSGQWSVLISQRTQHYIRRAGREDYAGLVWDITVPSGAFVARRRGKVFVTGNCPEKGHGDSEAAEAMVSLTTRGRKRGFAPIFATQRLGKLRKDVAAELLNVLIGQTFIDIDRKRAADCLGVPSKEERSFFDQVKVMEPGTFWGLGRAIATERVLIHVGSVETTHPEPGSARHAAAPPPAPGKVKALLPKLQDLPKEAEQEAQDRASLRAEVIRLKRELAGAQRAQPAGPKPAPFPQVDLKKIQALRQLVEEAMKLILSVKVEEIPGKISEADREALQRAIRRAVETGTDILQQKLKQRAASFQGLRARAERVLREIRALTLNDIRLQVEVTRQEKFTAQPTKAIGYPGPQKPMTRRSEAARWQDGAPRLPPGEKATLTAAAQHQDGVYRDQLSVLTGYRRSSRDAYTQRLREKGLVSVEGDRILATKEGMEALGDAFEPLPVGEALRDYWMQRLPPGEKVVLESLIQAYPDAVHRDKLSEATKYARSSRDAYVQRLKARRLVELVGRGEVRASAMLFG